MIKEEVKNTVKQYVTEVKSLPRWLRVTGMVFAILGAVGTLYGLWGTHLVAQSIKNTDLNNFCFTVRKLLYFNRGTTNECIREKHSH